MTPTNFPSALGLVSAQLASCLLASCLQIGCFSQLDDLQPSVRAAISRGPELPISLSATGRPSASANSGDAGAAASASSSGTPGGTASSTASCQSEAQDSDGLCLPERHCAPGTYVAGLDGTWLCTPCESGTFSTTYDASQCMAWSVCQAGEYVLASGSATQDRKCDVCPEASTSSTENAGECSSASDCPLGTIKDGLKCTACAAGSYCSGKADTAEICVSATWDDDANPATPCIAVTSCVAGQYVKAEGSPILDRACSFCAAGSYSTAANAASCLSWSTCSPGSSISQQGTADTDRLCRACTDGNFADAANAVSCLPWSTCTAPLYYAALTPTAAQDRGCTECPLGQTSAASNAAMCKLDLNANLARGADFENGSGAWFSWVGTVATSTAKAHGGTHCLLIAGQGTGPAAINLDAAAVPGATYSVTFWVSVGSVSTALVNITRELICAGNKTYALVTNSTSVASGGWTPLTGNFSIDAGCTEPKLQVYAEGSGANVDLYVDDVVITKSK